MPAAATPFPNPIEVVNASSPEETPASFYCEFDQTISLNGIPQWVFTNGATISSISLYSPTAVYVTCNINIAYESFDPTVSDSAITGAQGATLSTNQVYIAGP
ncbi:MAG: hypothetical protein WAM11_04250 [Cyanobium sp.]